MEKIKDIDLEILRILSQDSRKKLRPIADELKRSPTTINEHIRIMEERKIIKGYSISIDYEKIGYDIIALIEVTISKGKMLEVERDIADHPNIFAVYDVTGEYDAIILARFKTRNELSNLVKKINSYEYVVRTNTHLILNVIKERTDFAKMRETEEFRES
jgi:DNA-binding Lrp family transcriptional regulator